MFLISNWAGVRSGLLFLSGTETADAADAADDSMEFYWGPLDLPNQIQSNPMTI